MAMLGMGLGPMGPAVTIAVQNAVERRDMGAATSLTSFFRSMGASFGVALLGAILLAGLAGTGAGGTLNASGILHGGPAVIATLPEPVRLAVVAGFTHSFRYVYLVGAAICVLALGLALGFRELPLRSSLPSPVDPKRPRP
jgi:hypothetical protein